MIITANDNPYEFNGLSVIGLNVTIGTGTVSLEQFSNGAWRTTGDAVITQDGTYPTKKVDNAGRYRIVVTGNAVVDV
jgi:hypothetical protein